MTITVANDRNSITIEESGQTVTLRPGEWSGWTEFVFPFNPLIKIHGISRFHLIASQPEVKLYLSPINFDPRNLPPGFKISTPPKWAPQLAKDYGLYKTLGWQIDTWAISEGFANEQMFWDDMTWTVAQDRKMFDAFLAGDDELMVQCFEFPDRVGHVFWRLMDPKHPAYDAALHAKWGDALLRSYQLMDAIVGDAMAAAEKKQRRADRPLRSRLRVVPKVRELQHLAGDERLHDAEDRRSGERPQRGDAVRLGAVLGERRLVEHARLRDGPRRDVHQPERAASRRGS